MRYDELRTPAYIVQEEKLIHNLEILADYLVLCMEKQEKKERKILTDNRMTTVDKREVSFEGLKCVDHQLP